MDSEKLSSILRSQYKTKILLILEEVEMDTPSRILRRLKERGLETANKPNLSKNLRWLKENELVKVEVDRPKGKIYKITERGKEYAKKVGE